MNKYRLLFEKTGAAAYSSHLDLQDILHRAFRRAGIALRTSEGFNPHALTSIALPLSVGQESVCELLDFEPTSAVRLNDVPDALNGALPSGIRASSCYIPARKASEIKWICVEGTLFYDELPDIAALAQIFRAETLVITKKTKRGEAELDLLTGLRDVKFRTDGVNVTLSCLCSAREPSVNPALLLEALLPKPRFAQFRRVNVFDGGLREFR